MLESAALGVPILCFADSGGAQEFVKDELGMISPYMDIESMADNILYLQRNPDLRKEIGSKAADKIRKNHNLEKNAHEIVRIINRLL